MNEVNHMKLNHLSLPFKSVAVALLFCAFLGPVGVLYSSVLGGVVMIVLGLMVLRLKLWALVLLVWLGSCVWDVAATNRLNKKILFANL